MKLSNRKQLLSEADAELKRIKSLNEAQVPQSEVEKATEWLRIANQVVGGKRKEKMDAFIEDFFRYLEIYQGGNPNSPDAKRFKKNAEFSIDFMDVLINNVKENLSTLKKLEAKLPEIQKIVRLVKSDMSKMK